MFLEVVHDLCKDLSYRESEGKKDFLVEASSNRRKLSSYSEVLQVLFWLQRYEVWLWLSSWILRNWITPIENQTSWCLQSTIRERASEGKLLTPAITPKRSSVTQQKRNGHPFVQEWDGWQIIEAFVGLKPKKVPLGSEEMDRYCRPTEYLNPQGVISGVPSTKGFYQQPSSLLLIAYTSYRTTINWKQLQMVKNYIQQLMKTLHNTRMTWKSYLFGPFLWET